MPCVQWAANILPMRKTIIIRDKRPASKVVFASTLTSNLFGTKPSCTKTKETQIEVTNKISTHWTCSKMFRAITARLINKILGSVWSNQKSLYVLRSFYLLRCMRWRAGERERERVKEILYGFRVVVIRSVLRRWSKDMSVQIIYIFLLYMDYLWFCRYWLNAKERTKLVQHHRVVLWKHISFIAGIDIGRLAWSGRRKVVDVVDFFVQICWILFASRRGQKKTCQ